MELLFFATNNTPQKNKSTIRKGFRINVLLIILYIFWTSHLSVTSYSLDSFLYKVVFDVNLDGTLILVFLVV